MQDGPRFLTETDIATLTTTKQTTFGGVGQTGDGRQYVYVGFGGTSTINPGLVLVAPAAPSNSTALVITATGTGGQVAGNLLAGSNTLVLTNGSTAVTQDQFQFIELIISAGGSYKLKLRGHTAAAATTGYITCFLQEPLPVGTTTLIPGTDTANLRLSPYNGPTASLTRAQPVGVTTVSVPNTSAVTNYGWVQTKGPAFVAATTATKGEGIAQDLVGTAGFVKLYGAVTDNLLGFAQEAAASSTASVELNIA